MQESIMAATGQFEPPDGSGARPKPALGLAAGARISHYEITGKIGEGGMGAVYKAVDVRLGRTVALKVISRDFITPDDRRRFAREANAASALNHPNIVTIYEYDSVASVDFIAMEYIEGKGLDRLLAEQTPANPLPLPLRLEYLRQVASAVAMAHTAGIVHRDLKPANIMVTAGGHVKVLDFGLARRDDPASDATLTALTRAGAIMGTPAYMSPEQALGEYTDARSDIFSFGVILYEAVCGKRPFQGRNSMAILNNIANNNPDPPWKHNPVLPDSLTALIEKCLAKDRKHRLSSLGDAVTEIAAAISITTNVHTPAKRFAPLPRRSLIAAAFVLGVAALVYTGRHWFTGNALSIESSNAYAHYQSGAALLLRSDRKGNPDRALAEFQKAIAVDAEFAPAYAGLADCYAVKNNVTPDSQWVRLARQAAERGVALTPDLSLVHVSLARAALASGEHGLAQKELARAFEIDPRNAEAHRWMGNLEAARRSFANAEKEYRTALELAPADWRIASDLGVLLYRNARYADAAAVWQSASARLPDNEVLHRNLGSAHHMLGHHDQAAIEFQKALEIEPSPTTFNNLGTSRFFQGRYSDAVAAFEKAVDGRANSYLYWGNLADAYRWATGMRAKANTAYTRAVQLATAETKSKPADWDLRSRLALYHAKLSDASASRAELAAIPAATTSAAVWFRAAIAWDLLQDRERALQSLDRAIKGGYPKNEIENEPELAPIRADRRYHVLMARSVSPVGRK